jgi:hypothetical protein
VEIIVEWLTALEAMELARALRRSVWVYPLVNTAHLLGVTLLIGAIVPLDLRLLGMWPSTPLAPLWRVLTRTAGTGLVVAIIFGTLLFITRATEYAASNLFLSKMMVVGAGTVNALILRVILPKDVVHLLSPSETPPRRARLAGGVSLGVWLTALTLGRLVGYF